MTQLAAHAQGAPELSFLARDALERQRLGAAQHYAKKALTADLSAPYAYIVCARVAAARHDYRFAADALRTALNFLADGAPQAELSAELASYEAVARTTVAAVAPASAP